MAMAMSSQGTGTRGAESLGPRKGLVVFSGGSAAVSFSSYSLVSGMYSN